jgi:hypothetical protein
MNVQRIHKPRVACPEIRQYKRLVNGYLKLRRDLKSLLSDGSNRSEQIEIQDRLGQIANRLLDRRQSLRLGKATAVMAGALALLHVAPVRAQSFSAVQTNPFGLTNAASYSTPAFVDLDGDGDFDVVSGRGGGSFSYFQNTGTATAPSFAAVVANPFGLTDIGNFSTVSFVDIDGDGDLDLLAGGFDGNFHYEENTGSATAPAFAAAVTNPFGLSYVGEASSAPRFVDLDGDGDFDMVSGDKLGNYNYYENTGTATAPAFAAPVEGAFGWTDVGQYSTPAPADLDGDGDFDLVSGDLAGNVRYYENTGTAVAPTYAALATNPFNLTDIGAGNNYSAVTLKDLDGDGDLDLLAGSKSGDFYYFENTLGTLYPNFPGRQTNPFGLTDIGTTTQDYSTAALKDLDHDGDLDLISGGKTGDFHYFRNDGTAIAPAFAAEAVNPFGLAATVGAYATPLLVDLDADGDYDVLTGQQNGRFTYFQNIGTAISPAFAAGVIDPFSLGDLGNYSTLAADDIDGDGDFDIIAGKFDGSFTLFRNVGTATAPSFAAAVANPFGLTDIGDSSAPALGDLDRDGDLDIVAGEKLGKYFYFANTGSAISPSYAAPLTDPYGLSDIGQYSTPAFADLDHDGDLDVVSGALDGKFYYFENQTPAPALTLVKSAAPMTYSAPGNLISYSYLITNSGNIGVSGLTVADDNDDAAGVTCPVTTLAAGASTTCTSQRTAIQADLDAGSITNTAIATATPASGGTVDSPSDSATVTVVSNPSLTLAKTAAPTTYSTVGNVINYSYLVTNSGNLTLNNLSVADDNDDAPGVTCPVTTLAPAASTTCTAQRTVAQADLDAGFITNTAIASSMTLIGGSVSSPSDSATVTAITNPSLSLVKSASPMTYAAAGNVIGYGYLVTNTGNLTLNNLSVADDNDDAPGVTCPVTVLAPNASTTCTSQRTVTQPDLDIGFITNTAIASSMTLIGGSASSPSDSATVTAIPNPSLSLAKSASSPTYSFAGEVLGYSYLVTNTGNLTVSNLTVADDNDDAPGVSCPITTLAPNASTTCTSQRTVTQADIKLASITNIAIASSTPSIGAQISSPPDSVTVTVLNNPSLTLVKSAGAATYSFVGEVVGYSYLVTNSGNLTLSNLTVADDNDDAPGVTCPVTTLAPNAATTCTAQRTVAQADLDAGSITNTAIATSTPSSGGPISSAPDSATVTAIANPSLSLVKTAGQPTYSFAGEVIGYSYLVTNTGNLTLNTLTVADDNDDEPPGVVCPVTTLAPTASTTCTSQRTVTQADIKAGSITNIAVASSLTPSSGAVSSPSDSATVTAVPSPSLTLVKSASAPSYSFAGEVVGYSYLVTNTGNLTLSNLTVADDNDDAPGVTCPVTLLSPGASTTCTSQRTVAQGDLDAGSITNTAIASSTPSSGGPIMSPPDSVTVTAIANPSMSLAKSAAPTTYAAPGDVIGYSYLVTNTGNLTLSNLSVADDNDDEPPGVACPVTTLAPNASTTCTAQRTVIQADLDAGTITNIAIANATDPSSGAVASPSDSATVTAVVVPSLSMVKTALQQTYVAAGDVLDYEYFITNTGNVTLINLTVDDDNDDDPPGVVCPVTTLAPAESTTCTSQRTVNAADLRAPAIVNTAIASSEGPTGATVASAAQSAVVRGNVAALPSLSPAGLFALIGTLLGFGLAFVRRRGDTRD